MTDQPQLSPVQLEQQEWLSEVIFTHTPAWAHALAYFATVPGLRWLRFLLPLARRLTDVKIKTDTTYTKLAGAQKDMVGAIQHMRVYKRGRLLGERKFNMGAVRSHYSRLVK